MGSVFNVMKEYDIPRKGYCFFHQQDIERCFGKPGTLYLAFHSMTGDEEIAMEVGQRIVELLRANHFDVYWEETLDRKIGIKNFHLDKQYDEQLSSVVRSLSVITKSHQ
ncbi:hypothetical protein BW731_07845 [Vagococcus martis]|uniref:DUF6891 domain-containing protein n=1 Tax=Vagococcus martis TaxID=1768210 RepID=A0A1V4DHQ3_9ENTE|nr:hypothetical protein [Vagococcus martis]OPF88087.1 hypothetical protein BW731_07845 [Vagococcus martis]